MSTRTLLTVFVLVGVSLGEATETGVQGQANEEQIAQAFELLGQMLGIPELTPEELKRKVEEVGGLRFVRDVPIDFMSREELAGYIRDLFDAEYPIELAEREERMLRGIGFLSEGQDLRTIRERVLNENIAGFYDERPQAKKLFAISAGRKLNLMNQLVLSHELRHALQDQHLNLGRILGEVSDFDDRRLAALALIEGDATLLMEKFLASGEQGGGMGMGELFGGLSGGLDARALAQMFAGPELRGAPPVVQEQLIVPYLHGRALAAEIFSRGGFALLNERLRNPPRSTEQVLHPEKYLDRVDEPMEVTLPAGVGSPTESEGRLGEVLIRSLFEGVLPQEQSFEAAAGWGGDRYAIWLDANDEYHLFWRTLWDTDRDADEFYEALAGFASSRFGNPSSAAAESGALSLKGADGSQTTVIRRGREVLFERDGFR
jgi:hypothetical protein